jgi:hypothetical protein
MFPSRTFLSVPKILLSILTHCTYPEDVSGNSSKCARLFWKIVTIPPDFLMHFFLCDLIGLLGDINAKTGKLLNYVETDKSLLNIFDLQDDVDLINYMYDYENIVNAGASLSRNSNCTWETKYIWSYAT